MVEGTWRKEPELTALRTQLSDLDRRIQLLLKPLEERAEAVEDDSLSKDSRQEIPAQSGREHYIPSRLQQIADASGGRIVIGRIPSIRNCDSSFKKKKI